MDAYMLERKQKVDRVLAAANRLHSDKAAEGDPTAEKVLHRLGNIKMAPGCTGSRYEGYFIVMGDWNRLTVYHSETDNWEVIDETMPRVAGILNEIDDVDIEWIDEMKICERCQKAYRSKPNSYSWLPRYFKDVCEHCWQQEPEEYLKAQERNPKSAVTLDIYPTDHGYERVEKSFVNGLHPGQASDPEVIAETLEAAGIYRYLFRIDTQGQFDTRFSVFVHVSEIDKVPELTQENTEASVSPAQMAQKALSSIPKDSGKGEGITYHSINLEDGSVKTSQISKQDFVEKGIQKALDEQEETDGQ